MTELAHDREDDRQHDQAHEARRARTGSDDVHGTPGKQTLTEGLATPPTAAGPAPTDEAGALAPATTALVHAAQGSASEPLPAALSAELEGALGASVAEVRVHTGATSATAAAALAADAFTVGKDVHFAPGRFDPATPAGRALIAHEVAHTLQATGTGGDLTTLEVSHPDDAHEQEAHAAGAAFAAGTRGPRPTRASARGVGRALISRSPTGEAGAGPAPGGAPLGVQVKVGTKGAAIAVSRSKEHELKGPCVKATFTGTLIGGGTLTWPQPEGVPEIDAGGTRAGAKATADAGIEQELAKFEATLNERAESPTEMQEWLDGFALKEIKLLGVGADTATAKAGHEFAAGLKVEAELVNGSKASGAVTIASLKTTPPTLEGPNIELGAALNVLKKEWKSESGRITFAGHLTGAAKVTIQPDWASLARDVAKELMQTSAIAALEMAASLAIIFAPAVAAASAISMLEDETALTHWIIADARIARDATISLWRGVELAAPIGSHGRSADAFAKGQAQAHQAIAAKGITPQEYVAAIAECPFWSSQASQSFRQGIAAFESSVARRVSEMYDASLSLRFWKNKNDLIRRYTTLARERFLSH